MAITVGASTTLAYGSSRSNTSISLPSHSAGDCLIVGLYQEDSTASVTVPSGFTAFTGSTFINTGPQSLRLSIAYKLNVSGSDTTAQWTHSAFYSGAFATAISGVVTSGNPVEAYNDDYTAYQTSLSIGQITTTAGALVCTASVSYSGTSQSSSTLTERADASCIAFSADVQAGAGATGNKSVTFTGTADIIGLLFALTPAGGGGGTVVPVFMNQYRQRWA